MHSKPINYSFAINVDPYLDKQNVQRLNSFVTAKGLVGSIAWRSASLSKRVSNTEQK